MRRYVLKRFWETLATTAGVVLLLLVLAVACDSDDGEDRPGVAVISESGSVSGTTGSVSGSVSGTTGSTSGSVSGATESTSGSVSGATGSTSGSVSGTTGSMSGTGTGTGERGLLIPTASLPRRKIPPRRTATTTRPLTGRSTRRSPRTTRR